MEAEHKNEELTSRLFDMEREVRSMINDREREAKDTAVRMSMETRYKEENKGKMLEDIHNLISKFKCDKKLNKSQHVGNLSIHSEQNLFA